MIHGDMRSIEKAIPYLENVINNSRWWLYWWCRIYTLCHWCWVKCVKEIVTYIVLMELQLTFSVKNKKFFVCHGHYHDVKMV